MLEKLWKINSSNESNETEHGRDRERIRIVAKIEWFKIKCNESIGYRSKKTLYWLGLWEKVISRITIKKCI